ncbi:MAG: response regulator [Saprospiraceae bacterium]|nr:response regulator [Pyrinomonadaceae bacterium]
MSDSQYRANVLLVDDRPDNLLALESCLAEPGQNLLRAESAREALRILLSEEIALILLDVQMPDVNGFDLAELIREREQTQHTPIIFISATSTTDQFIFKGYSLGAVDYITKPFNPDILRSKVRFFTEYSRQHQEIKRQAELLEQTNLSLDSTNIDLEARVRVRTEELEVANRELETEIAVRTRSESRLTIEHSITKTLADADNLQGAAGQILQTFCENMDADVCALWILNDSETELHCVRVETAEGAVGLDTFLEVIGKTDFPKSVGLPGYVWEKSVPVWIRYDFKGLKFPRSEIAAAVGLKSAIGFPVKVGKKFHGAIEIFSRKEFSRDEDILNMMDAIGSEIGQYVHRKRVESEKEKLLLREKALREKAEEASRLKDEFLATVSHELRTPLNAILGWGQILQEGKLPREDHDAAITKIYRNAKSQAQLIDDLLDTSNLIAGNLRLSLSPLSIAPVVEAALDSVRPIANSKEITLSVSSGEEIGEIVGDSQRLQQVIWNLVSNAVKFTPKNGEVKVLLEESDDTLRIIVSDTGNGIPPEFLPFVFDRFRQADSSSIRGYDGLGLGLAIVRHLAELHGGSVSATSDYPDGGSVFTVALPRPSNGTVPERDVSPEKITEKAEATTATTLKDFRILIVDDDSESCKMLTVALELLGAEIRTSGSAAAAYESIVDWRPMIIFSDINMPGEDGYSLLKRIKASSTENIADIPVVALTAMARSEDNEKAVSAGFALHISKPVDLEKIVQTIRDLAAKNGSAGNSE